MNTSFYPCYIVCILQDLINAITGNYYYFFYSIYTGTQHATLMNDVTSEQNKNTYETMSGSPLKGKPTNYFGPQEEGGEHGTFV